MKSVARFWNACAAATRTCATDWKQCCGPTIGSGIFRSPAGIADKLPGPLPLLAIWLGITRVGGVVALINSNLKGEALSHCLKLSGAKHVIVAEDRADELERSGADLRRYLIRWIGPAIAYPQIAQAMDPLRTPEPRVRRRSSAAS